MHRATPLEPGGPSRSSSPRRGPGPAAQLDERPLAEGWRRRAACRGLDPAIFHPADEEDTAAAAKAVCARCPVREACLEYALAWRETHGVWGGLTARERRRLLRRRRRSA